MTDANMNGDALVNILDVIQIINLVTGSLSSQGPGSADVSFSIKGDDLYLNAETAKKWGLADHIGVPQLQVKISVEMTLEMSNRKIYMPSKRSAPFRVVETMSDSDSSDSSDSDADDEPSKKKRKRKNELKRKGKLN